MTFLSRSFNSSAVEPHRSYRAYLRAPPAKAPKFARLRQLASRSLRGRRPKGFRRLATSEHVLPHGIRDDLPGYEESERRNAAEGQPPSDDLWIFKDPDIRLTVVDTHGQGCSSQNFQSRWEFLCFLRQQIDEITEERTKLERKVAALRHEVDSPTRRNAHRMELNERLQLHVAADGR
ncbi:MAG: hypothetical protein Q9226_004132 [Calogaya cf. arnoldii]